MRSTKSFNRLNGREATRSQIENIIRQAKDENNTEIVYRLSKILNDNPRAKRFLIEVKKYGLNAPRHSGIYKEALNECGRLKKGWKFEGGAVVWKGNERKSKRSRAKSRFTSTQTSGGNFKKSSKSTTSKPAETGLNSKGQLKKGFRYIKGGKIVRVKKKVR